MERVVHSNADGSVTLREGIRELTIPAGASTEDFETARAGFFESV